MISLGSSTRELQVIRQALKLSLNEQNWCPEDEEEATVSETKDAIQEVEHALMFARWRDEGDEWWKEISKNLKYFKIGDKEDE